MLHIVTHAWAEKNTQFAAALAYQLSSLVLYEPAKPVNVTVVCTNKDCAVGDVVARYRRLVDVCMLYMPIRELGRRSIGRNKAAKHWSVHADYIWFADCDYFFGDGCLDAISDYQWPDDCMAVFPRQVLISKTHAVGDAQLERIVNNEFHSTDVDPIEFEPKKYHRAIGGAQIVRGDFAREHGYLDGEPRWQQPTDNPFADTREDVYFRRELEKCGKIIGIDLPNCFRCRHTEGHPK